MMATGTVKWFNPTKGYGFIQPQGGGKDVFVHISAVERAGLNTLNEGQTVEYEIVSNRGKESADRLKVRWRHGLLTEISTTTRSAAAGLGKNLQILVRDNNVDQALRALKKKMQREGVGKMTVALSVGLRRSEHSTAGFGLALTTWSGAPGSK
jgi:cold shock protein